MERVWGEGARPLHRGRDPGVPGAPHPLLLGLDYRAPPRGGVRGWEIPHGVSVCARFYVCEVAWCPGAPRGRLEPRRHARLRPSMGEERSWPTGTPAIPSSSTPLPPGRRADPQRTRGSAALFPRTRRWAHCTLYGGRKGRARRPHVQRERHLGLTLEGRGAERGGMDCVGALGAGRPAVAPSGLVSLTPPHLTSPLPPLWHCQAPAPAGARLQTTSRGCGGRS